MVEITLTVDKEFFDKHKENKEYFGGGEGDSFYEFTANVLEDYEITDTSLRLIYTNVKRGEISISVEHDLRDPEFLVKLSEILIKKYNKAKSLFETIK